MPQHNGLEGRTGTDGWIVVPVTGDLDFTSAHEVGAELDALTTARRPHHVVLDMHAVEFMDSTGLRVLLGLSRRLRTHGGTLRLAGVSDLVSRLLDITQVGPLLPTYPTVEAACGD
ncbi:STAS domain-containing protein [Yinghuangia seranimata]|uniref:STAS domain-containing protein n=1 Tax=Yinghuangia seranimata TaxID=408067 RepID=UPI00248CDBD8|nr:STAS domain-containing protein [Yinghuangia seranimata]MDI2130920.1 STAS domain-containing protein [Yinghuangia seranimata]